MTLTPAQMREDLAFLRDEWCPLDRSFSGDQRREFNELVGQAITAADSLSPADFELEIMRAVAIIFALIPRPHGTRSRASFSRSTSRFRAADVRHHSSTAEGLIARPLSTPDWVNASGEEKIDNRFANGRVH